MIDPKVYDQNKNEDFWKDKSNINNTYQISDKNNCKKENNPKHINNSLQSFKFKKKILHLNL